MNKTISIDQATNEQLDYAAAIAQGWEYHKGCFIVGGSTAFGNGRGMMAKEHYHPTTDQAQCGILIDVFDINTQKINDRYWRGWVGLYWETNHTVKCDKSRLIAAVKALLWSKYPDGMMPVYEEIK